MLDLEMLTKFSLSQLSLIHSEFKLNTYKYILLKCMEYVFDNLSIINSEIISFEALKCLGSATTASDFIDLSV